MTKFAGNLLTIIVPAGSPAGIATPADLAKTGVKVIAAGDAVPITKYATQLVANLAGQAGYPADFAAKYAANIVSKEDNVAAVVAKIELGEGDAGIVYVTDATSSTKVATIAVPDAANVPATYAGVVVKASANAAAGQAFLAWLAGPDGQAILASFGFLPPVPMNRPMARPMATLSMRATAEFVAPRLGQGWGSLPVVALAGLAGLLLGLPVAVLVLRAILDGSLANAMTEQVVLSALALSLGTTAISLVITVALGLPLAIVLARRRFRGAGLVEAIVDLPIVLPPSVAGLALLLVLGRRGMFGGALEAAGLEIPFTTLAVIVAQTFVSAPFFVRSARAGIAAVDRDFEDAARVDGATEAGLFRHITAPLAGAALAAGLVMSWARSLGEFGATIMFAGNVGGRTQTLPLMVYGEFQGGNLDGSVAAAAILVLAAFGVLVAVRVLHWGRALDLRSMR